MFAGGIMLLALAVLLALGVGLLVAGLRRSGRGYPSCGRCGYDVRGAERVQDTCPECGERFYRRRS